jgi:hypothetical protein
MVLAEKKENNDLAQWSRGAHGKGIWHRLATVKSHGWVYAVLGMGVARPSTNKVNSYERNLLSKRPDGNI